MKPGLLEYRCRRCGAIDASIHSPDVGTTVICAVVGARPPFDGIPVKMTSVHLCADGSGGVTDLIGSRPDAATENATKIDHQTRVWKWVQEVFSEDIVKSPHERALRFLEESLELVQAVGLTRENCHRLVDYVFDRPTGEPSQETGGVMVTLYALASAIGIDVNASARTEIERIETPEIRKKVIQRQAEKRKSMVGA